MDFNKNFNQKNFQRDFGQINLKGLRKPKINEIHYLRMERVGQPLESESMGSWFLWVGHQNQKFSHERGKRVGENRSGQLQPSTFSV